MISDTDAYRILGLTRGATTDEVKRAYRRLAKIHHPDAAGEKNLPRFLAIQQAYEQLTGGLDGSVRPRRPSGARRPWDADPDRADATRRAYGGRARGASSGRPAGGGGTTPGNGGAGAGAGPGPGPTSGSGSTTGAGPASARGGSGAVGGAGASDTTGGTRSPGSGAPAAGSTRDGRRRRRAGTPPGSSESRSADGAGPEGAARPAEPKGRKRNKATFGSTSYDGVEGPFEPDWRGASWYGTTSGTYWTLNPKEYADPRKHGPEYQARARRATRAWSTAGAPPDAATDETAAAADAPDLEPPPEATAAREPGAPPTHTTSSWWDSTTGTTGPAPAQDWASTGGSEAADQRTVPAPPPDLGRAMADIGRALTDEGFGGLRGRVARAIIGWLPIAFGIGWMAGEMTGCGRFAATCDGTADPFVLLLQAAVLVLLLLVPALASVTVMASIALLSAAVVATLILSATGEAADGDARRSVLGVVLLLAWLAGLAIAVARRVRALSPPATPVS